MSCALSLSLFPSLSLPTKRRESRSKPTEGKQAWATLKGGSIYWLCSLTLFLSHFLPPQRRRREDRQWKAGRLTLKGASRLWLCCPLLSFSPPSFLPKGGGGMRGKIAANGKQAGLALYLFCAAEVAGQKQTVSCCCTPEKEARVGQLLVDWIGALQGQVLAHEPYVWHPWASLYFYKAITK